MNVAEMLLVEIFEAIDRLNSVMLRQKLETQPGKRKKCDKTSLRFYIF